MYYYMSVLHGSITDIMYVSITCQYYMSVLHCTTWTVILSTESIVQSHTGVLPVAKRLTLWRLVFLW